MQYILTGIAVYGGTALVLFLLGMHVWRREQRMQRAGGGELSFFSWEIVASILLLATIAGLRWMTGYDHEKYYNQYVSVLDTGEFMRISYEPFFRWVTYAFAAIKAHFTLYFGFWALLQFGLLYYGLRHDKHLLPWVALVLMLGPWFLFYMNTIRQYVIESLFVVLVPLIARKRFWLYVACVVPAVLVHRFAWLLIPLYAFAFVPVKRIGRQWLALSLLGVALLLGIKPVWLTMFRPVVSWFASLGLGWWYEQDFVEVISGNFRQVSYGPSRIVCLATVVMIVALYPHVRRYFKHDKALPVFYAIMIVGECLHNLLVNTSFYFLRPVELLTICTLVMTAYTLSYLYQKRRYILLPLMLIVSCSNATIDLVKSVVTPSPTTVVAQYHFFFEDYKLPVDLP